MTTSLSRMALAIGAAAILLAAASLPLIVANGDSIWDSATTGSVILAISFAAVGAVLAFKRSEHPIGWIFLIAGVANSLNAFSAEYPTYVLVTDPGSGPLGPLFSWIQGWIWAIGAGGFPLILLLFPDGRSLSNRWRWVLWVVLAGIAAAVVGNMIPGAGWAPALQRAGLVLLGSTLVAAVISLFIRFHRASGITRLQIKWLGFAAVITLVVLVTISPAAPLEVSGLLESMLSVLGLIALPSIPAAVGIAILRYRLYDIDFVINRALVYAALTVALGGSYVVLITLFQAALRPVTGSSDLAIVASTLGAAALFRPLRWRIQSFIDRRFYRRKYDAAATIEGFSRKLKEEIDLGDLALGIDRVVRDTLQPDGVILWLHPGETTVGAR